MRALFCAGGDAFDMRIFVDVDGTLTDRQCAKSAFRANPRHDMIAAVRKLASEGHEIVLWTGNTEYAKRAAEALGVPAAVCVGKPQMIVDNEVGRWSRRLHDRTISPEEFLAKVAVGAIT